ncbi:nitroreductase [Mycetocola tolaasinivorans]|uniref:Putative NAD(P)H nitroreductase n=1 Tax=Mycetocola tolaasinivorans TaxID=76635 RepID=A0A3L7ADI3_9MICO|nr:nitroreductase family protein [Mycetocola tolaasinivorans]RLP77442.1 nitroreductase [Mycetocola tolaasinivorans]
MSAGAYEAALARRSRSKVSAETPDHAELLRLVGAAGRVADHSGLEPWRLIELRGDARIRLGAALSAAEGKDSPSSKPLRAELLIAVVFSPRKSHKVPEWEQEAVASGVAHVLSLLLDEAGWGVLWRTGGLTRSEPVHEMHALAPNEKLLGWLYVGGKIPREKSERPRTITAEKFLSVLDA